VRKEGGCGYKQASRRRLLSMGGAINRGAWRVYLKKKTCGMWFRKWPPRGGKN